MISVEGAKLLAQLIPFGILILAVERRWLGPEPEPALLFKRLWYTAKGLAQALVAAASALSMVPVFAAVNENQPIRENFAPGILVSAYGLLFVVLGVLVELVMRSYFGREYAEHAAEQQRRRDLARQELRRIRRARKIASRRVAARRAITPRTAAGTTSVEGERPGGRQQS